ncbi:hypothetical protein C3F09_07400 [candidate division GN15 bacterium]|uniref:Radical SAM core domain-containing protein n=1 Tax=candidate division GN15 bacterium TaxID=2072418 RepID=A0A855X6K9_9BACT|nr:MAG: hypothetical protein C3F09_07400 [candidate division GN15 bacterium]
MDHSPITSVALCLTHNCNLRCKYCYAGTKSQRSMSVDTARQALDFLDTQSSGKCAVTFFGGEPLLEFECLKETVRYAGQKYPGKFEFRFATNGVLLAPDVFQFLREHKVYFSLSIDGSPKQHDCNRVTQSGHGSYEQIAGVIADTLEYNPYTIAVSVLTPATVPYFADGVKHLFGLGFRYVLQTLDYSSPWQKQDIDQMKRQYRTLADYYFDSLAAGRKIYYSPFDSRIQTWAQKPIAKGDLCDLANSQIAIAASGRIYPCVQFVAEDDTDSQHNAIGDIWSGFNSDRRNWFIEQNRVEIESCAGCALLGRCATYCGCINWRTTGCLNRIPPIICEHERMLMPIVDQLANKLWKRDVDLFKRKFYEKSFPITSYIEDCLIRSGGKYA